MSDKKWDDEFTSGKFMPRATDEPVVGWVTMTADIKREYAATVQRAVVISDDDRETLREIREIVYPNDNAHGDSARQLALLDRLIGR
jgi:hypothetical protein